MSTAARDVRNALKMCLASTAGAEYYELKYVENVTENSFNQGKDLRYGVRPGITPENGINGTTGHLTYTQSFEFVLTKGYCESAHDDFSKYETFLDLHEIALRFYNKVFTTKAGLPSRVLNAVNLVINEPEFLTQSKVTVLTGNVDIIYRLTL